MSEQTSDASQPPRDQISRRVLLVGTAGVGLAVTSSRSADAASRPTECLADLNGAA